MYDIVKLMTSLPRAEVDQVDRIGRVVGSRQFRRASTLRSMLRFALAHEQEFVGWMERTNNKPSEGGE